MYEAATAANTDAVVDGCTAGSGADTINIPDGTYDLASMSFGPTFSATTTLVGQSRSSTILNATGGYQINLNGSNDAPTFTLRNLTLQDLVIQATSDDASYLFDNILMYGANSQIVARPETDGTDFGTFTITDSSIRNSEDGLLAQYFETITITDSSFYANTNNNMQLIGTTVSLDGVDIYDSGAGAEINGGTVSLLNMNVFDNTAGGITVFNGNDDDAENLSITIRNFALVRNTYDVGLMLGTDGGTGFSVDIANMTIADNTSLLPALAFSIRDSIALTGTMNNVTVANNTRSGDVGGATYAGGAMINASGGVAPTMAVKNLLIANNLDETTERNCAPVGGELFPFISDGNNLSDDSTCNSSFNQASDQNGVNAVLGTLAQVNGTWVVPLLAGSPAIDSGATISGLTTDQRGASRPQGSAYDLGAYEYSVLGEETPDPTPTPSPTNNLENTANPNTLAVTGITPVSTLLLLGIILAIGTYTYLDYRKYKKPLTDADPSVRYSYTHHIKVVSLPLFRYRLSFSTSKVSSKDESGIHKF